MRNDRVKPGMAVTTETTSGESIVCTVVSECKVFPGSWLLASPAHGYAIERRHTEFNCRKT